MLSWRKAEDNFLRKWWPTQTRSWDGWVRLTERHTWHEVEVRANVLGLNYERHPSWSDAEDEYLEGHISSMAKALGRTPEDVAARWLMIHR